MRTHRVVILLVGSVLAVTSLSLLAQGPPAAAPGNLSAAVADLQARVAALEAAPPGAGGLKVLDATDKVVGFWDIGDGIDDENPNTVSLINGTWLGVSIDTDGFKAEQSTQDVWFTSSNCSGQIYLSSDWSIVRGTFVFGQTLHYPGEPFAELALGSNGRLHSDGSVTDCFSFAPGVALRRVGPIAQVDVASLGTAPFRIAVQ